MTKLTPDYTFSHYLAAKKSVDDRALNQPVWAHLQDLVRTRRTLTPPPFTALEIGAGIGTMVERMLAWRLFPDPPAPVLYTAIDAQADNIAAARRRLTAPPPWLTLDWRAVDLFAFAAEPPAQAAYDLLIAHAFLDLVDIPRTLPLLKQLLKPGGIFYFTINFDGATELEPEIGATFDQRVEQLYHRTMDERSVDGAPSGDSRSGRHLFGHLRQAGFGVQAAGSSDWVVFAADGVYPADEAYFLHFIVHTMDGALHNHPALDGEQFAAWIAQRHSQIDRGELVYIAHQLDFCGVVAP